MIAGNSLDTAESVATAVLHVVQGGFSLDGMSLSTWVLYTTADLGGELVLGGIFIAGGLRLIYTDFDEWKKMRVLQDTPTEKVRSVAAGRTKLKGVARPVGDAIGHPFGDRDCIAVAYEIEKLQKRRKTKTLRRKWKTISTGVAIEPFELDDGTGTIRVDAREVDVEFSDEYTRQKSVKGRDEPPSELVEFVNYHTDRFSLGLDGLTGMIFSDPRRYTIQWIPVGQELCVLGNAEPADNTSGLTMRKHDVSDMFLISPVSELGPAFKRNLKPILRLIGGATLVAFGLVMVLPDFVI